MGRPSKAEQQARNAADGADPAGTGTSRRRAAIHRRTTPPQSDEEHVEMGLAQLPQAATPAGKAEPAFDPLLTIDQLAQWLGKPKGTLYQWRCRSMGPRGIKVGNDLRYRRSEVEAYLDANTDKRDTA